MKTAQRAYTEDLLAFMYKIHTKFPPKILFAAISLISERGKKPQTNQAQESLIQFSEVSRG